MNYYNEFCPTAAAWLQQLIDDKQIPNGYVDSRSILEVSPSDIAGFSQCHWFAGVGGWPLALRLAGWPDDRAVWSASLPCQPFSTAGKQAGTGDDRHLWPVFERLVRACKPPVLIGEQVASKLARDDWFPGVRLDLEALGYEVGAADLCAPCAGEIGEGWIVRGDQESWERITIGAPHIRQRLYWVADCGVADAGSRDQLRDARCGDEGVGPCGESLRRGMQQANGDVPCGDLRLADPNSGGCVGRAPRSKHPFEGRPADSQPVEYGELQAGSEGPSGLDGFEGPAPGRLADASSKRRDGIDTLLRTEETRAGRTGHFPEATWGGEADPDRGLYDDEWVGEDGWQRVSFAADCLGGEDEELGDECSLCGHTYAEDCDCPGPTQDGYEYAERDGTLYARWVGDAGGEGPQGHSGDVHNGGQPGWLDPQPIGPTGTTSWSDFDILPCRDGKARRVESSTFPLVAGLPRGVVPSGDPSLPSYANQTAEARAMRLKGYGNAICAPLAAAFIRSYCDARL